MQDHGAATATGVAEPRYPKVTFRVADDQEEDARLFIDDVTGDAVVSLHDGLVSDRGFVTLVHAFERLSDYVHVPVPDHLRAGFRQQITREEAP